MKLDVYATIAEAEKAALSDADAVVIDVLRMTSTVTNALSQKAKKIMLVGEEDRARAVSKKENAYLGGERGGVKLGGFAFGNSPLEYTEDRVSGKSIVMTTTNGARAAEAAMGAKSVRLCSFINVSAVAEKVKNARRVAVLCAGTHDAFSLDDCLCAGALCACLKADSENDLAVCMRLLFESQKENLHAALSDTKHYRYLKSIGFLNDLDFCLNMNTHACVPVLGEDGWFVSEE